MSKFNKCVFVSIIIPSVQQDGRPVTEEDRREALEVSTRAMGEMFGGFTALPGEGGWVSFSGKLHRESVTKVESACFHEGRHLEEALEGLIALAQKVKGLLNQEAVMVSCGDSVDFV